MTRVPPSPRARRALHALAYSVAPVVIAAVALALVVVLAAVWAGGAAVECGCVVRRAWRRGRA